MKRISLCLLAILSAILLSGCTLPSIPSLPGTKFQSTGKLPEAHNAFGFDIFNKLLGEVKEDENLFISPSSIALALTMTYNGAAGDTQKAMAEVLHINGLNIKDINLLSSNLISNLENPDNNVEIAIANSLWASKDIEFLSSFIKTNQKFFKAQVESVDFSNPSTINRINNWVKENTKGKIPTIIKPPMPADRAMYLINAIYFNGTWTHAFNENDTEERPFTLSNGQKKQHPLMRLRREDFQYLENPTFQAISLPYGKNERMGMYVFLPKENLSTFLKQLNMDNWKIWIEGFSEMEGRLLLPKFKTEYEKELSEVLNNLGMGIAFGFKADFSKMSPDPRGLYISKVRHKTYIDIHEKGTEAAAATSVEMVPKAVLQEKKTFYMEVNKPFFFAIRDNESGELLFMGIINNPSL
jgi:serine protease inhibitor